MKALKETNYEDKIKLASNERLQFISLQKYLINTKDSLQKYQEEANSLINHIIITRKNSEDIKLKIAILGEIGLSLIHI